VPGGKDRNDLTPPCVANPVLPQQSHRPEVQGDKGESTQPLPSRAITPSARSPPASCGAWPASTAARASQTAITKQTAAATPRPARRGQAEKWHRSWLLASPGSRRALAKMTEHELNICKHHPAIGLKLPLWHRHKKFLPEENQDSTWLRTSSIRLLAIIWLTLRLA
jgi:hypothetical protein